MCIRNILYLYDFSICNFLRLVSGPSTSTSRPSTSASDQGPSTSVSINSVSGTSDLEGRIKKMESNIDSLKTQQITEKVSEVLKHVRTLAGRPKLTSASVLIAAMEVLVDCAHKAGNPDMEFYSKALQACRQFEGHDDICNLCLKLVGSSEDKKMSATIADWQKTTKRNDNVNKAGDQSDGRPCHHNTMNDMPSQSTYPYPSYPFQHPMNFGQGYPPLNGPLAPPFMHIGSRRPTGYRPRPPRKGRGSCFFCKENGHHVAECPKLKKE